MRAIALTLALLFSVPAAADDLVGDILLSCVGGGANPVADGSHAASYQIQAADERGGGLGGLALQATLFAGDDWRTQLPVEDLGGGDYAVDAVSRVAGPAVVTLTINDDRVGTCPTVNFAPGAPDHFWIANKGTMGPTGSFDLMLKDPLDNLIADPTWPPIVTSPDPNAIFTMSSDPAGFPHFTQSFSSPGIYTPANGTWTRTPFTVADPVTGTVQTDLFDYPVMPVTPGHLDGLGSLTFSSSNFTAFQGGVIALRTNGMNVFSVTFDDPNPGDGVVPELLFGSAYFDLFAITGSSTEPVTDFLRVRFDGTMAGGMGDVIVDGTLRFDGKPPTVVPTTTAVVKPPKDFCVKVWAVAGTAQATIDAQIAKMKEIFGNAVKLCCPAFNFKVEQEAITAAQWAAIDADGDSKLKEYTDVTKPTNEEQTMMTNHKKAKCLNVYVVPGMSDGSLGEAFPPEKNADGKIVGGSVVVNGPTAADTTLAHEAGHVLGEFKDNTAGLPASNLMWQTAHDPKRTGLTKEQCATIAAKDP